jgi:hypothetical protein
MAIIKAYTDTERAEDKCGRQFGTKLVHVSRKMRNRNTPRYSFKRRAREGREEKNEDDGGTYICMGVTWK